MTDICTKEVFSVRLKQALKEKGISQGELQRRLDTTSKVVWSWTAGRWLPDLYSFSNICRVTGINPMFLMYGIGPVSLSE